MDLKLLIKAAGLLTPDAESGSNLLGVEITGIAYDSRQVKPGNIFCCVRGLAHDGHQHIESAVTAGAVAILADRPIVATVPVVMVDEVRPSMAQLSSAFFEEPSRHLTVIGVTGTNGKTSVAHLLTQILSFAGRQVALSGTLTGERTTPEAPDLQQRLAQWKNEGMDSVIMEVSSHALEQHRAGGTSFAAVAFTNLSRDHLDYHLNLTAYREAKERLFSLAFSSQAVVVVDDQVGQEVATLARTNGLEVTTVSSNQAKIVVHPASTVFTWQGHEVVLPLGGKFMATNALVAAELAQSVGVDSATIVEALQQMAPVPGRFETIASTSGPVVVIDYAHTPEALTTVLTAARSLAGGKKVLLVFGCGGNRDHGKRPLMGAAAQKGADLCFVTSDNPRDEPPRGVIEDILIGMTEQPALKELDRAKAIAAALHAADPGDVVVVAGKGHEQTQEIAGQFLPFDDRQIVEKLLLEMNQ